MLSTNDTETAVADIVASYETRIQNVETLLETAHQFLGGFQDSVLNTRQEREEINNQLRQTLANNGSLRKKDFDSMISIISSRQDQEEQEIRNLSKNYLNEQTNLVHELGESLGQFRDALAGGEAKRVKEFQMVIKDIFARQEKRKEEVVSRLKEFQQKQQETAKMLRGLLAKGRNLRIRDLKLMLAGFRRQCTQCAGSYDKKKKESQSFYGDFKKARLEASRNLVAATTTVQLGCQEL